MVNNQTHVLCAFAVWSRSGKASAQFCKIVLYKCDCWQNTEAPLTHQLQPSSMDDESEYLSMKHVLVQELLISDWWNIHGINDPHPQLC